MTQRLGGAERFRRAAADLGWDVEPTHFPDGTRTAQDAADAIGCDVAAIVKSLVFSSDRGVVMALTSGANRVDTSALARALGVDEVRRADADQVRAATGYSIGGVAPIGHADVVPMVIDRDLLALAEVWAAAGTPDTVFPLAPDRLVAATRATVADIKA